MPAASAGMVFCRKTNLLTPCANTTSTSARVRTDAAVARAKARNQNSDAAAPAKPASSDGLHSPRIARSVRRLNKGPERPILPEDERAELLAGLACVDFVTIFDEPTADAVLAALKPTVYAKGGDYTPDSLPEAPTVRAYGGRIEILPFVPGRSTTSLIARIIETTPERTP